MTSIVRFSKADLKAPFLAFLMNFCPLKMWAQLASLTLLNETFLSNFQTLCDDEVRVGKNHKYEEMTDVPMGTFLSGVSI